MYTQILHPTVFSLRCRFLINDRFLIAERCAEIFLKNIAALPLRSSPKMCQNENESYIPIVLSITLSLSCYRFINTGEGLISKHWNRTE